MLSVPPHRNTSPSPAWMAWQAEVMDYHARHAVALYGVARHVYRHAGQQRRHPPDVGRVALLADAAQDHVVEQVGVDAHPVDDLLERPGRPGVVR